MWRLRSLENWILTRIVAPAKAWGHLWVTLGVLLVAAGTVGAALAADGVAHEADQSSHKSFVNAAASIAANLRLAIQHENDLVVDAQAFVLGTPNATEAEFVAWAQDVRAMVRYPEVQGIGSAAIVPASQLPAFAQRPLVRTATGSTVAGPFEVVPPGSRPFYCLTMIGFDRTARDGLPPGFDLCAGSQGKVLLATRDSGRDDLEPLTVYDNTTLSFAVPIYRGGAIPGTVAARQQAFIGWVGMSIVPKVILVNALRGHPDSAVALRFGGSGSTTKFRSGAAPPGAQRVTVGLDNGWTVVVLGAAGDGGLLGDSSALTLLLAGIVLSLLVGALIYVLGTGRARSMALVHERTDQLRFQALHDSLTGLPNRALILDRIELMLARARRNHLPAAVMFLDLDDFKDINDTLGHHAGDQLLVGVGLRLAATLREGDTAGRLGGDEFVLLVEGNSLAAGVEVVADRILDALRPPFEIGDGALPLSISASIGIALGDRLTPEELLRDADAALYQAKGTGKHRAVVFTSSMQGAAQDHRVLDMALRGALEAGEFFLVYQPTIDLQSGEITGVEALLRWRHPERGVVQPNDFVPQLEANGLIVPVGAWVLEQACRQGAVWHAQGHLISVSVNVSAKQLERHRIVEDVEHALAVSGFDPTMLILELTETALMNQVSETTARLGLLKLLGVRLAVDDFGTGYSSMAYLRQFPIDILKIDQAFVAGITTSTESAALVHMLVQLGKSLSLETIAEGIEDNEQRVRLRAEKVDTGQGFLFSRPLAVQELGTLLETSLGHYAGSTRAGPR